MRLCTVELGIDGLGSSDITRSSVPHRPLPTVGHRRWGDDPRATLGVVCSSLCFGLPMVAIVHQAEDHSDERHFNGLLTRLVVQYLVATQSADALRNVLTRAGEIRPLTELLSDGSWSSYKQIRQLLQAVSAELGPEHLERIAPATGRDHDPAEAVAPLLQLGSPMALLHEGVAGGTALGMATVIIVVGGEPLHPDGYRISLGLDNGFEPFAELCSFLRGLLAVVPTVFGLPAGVVDEESCQCSGAPQCTMVVRWQPLGTDAQQARLLRSQVGALEHRLSAMQDMLDELVTTDNLHQTLTRVADTAASALRVPAHALVLDRAHHTEIVRIVGATEAEALAAVDQVGEHEPAGPRHRLVAEVASHRRHFGHLAVLDPSREFRPHEQRMLASYAKIAAAALDAATAISDATSQAATASALLRLSRALNHVLPADDLAEVLARSLPQVLDSDRIAVILGDPRTGGARVAAAYGYPEDIADRFADLPVRLPPLDAADRIEVLRIDQTDEPATHRQLAASGTLAAAVVPVVVDGQHAGQIVVAVTERPERLTVTPELEERLLGVAGLTATALRNSMLVDAIRHQATHDALTGLPNRASISERLLELLSPTSTQPVTLLFVDLDGFKDVNDTLGHSAGDHLLTTVATRLRQAVRAAEIVGRLGGDEFVVLSTSPTRWCNLLAERILARLRQPVTIPDMPAVTITASIGIAVGEPVDPTRSEDTPAYRGDRLLREADIALYEAKALGKDRAVQFDPAMAARTRTRTASRSDRLLSLTTSRSTGS